MCRRPAAACALLFVVALCACGKKGPPLAPFSTLPAAVTSLTAKRVGSQIVVRFTVPTANVDGRQPADLDRVDVYADETPRVRPVDYLTRGAIVGSVKIHRAVQAGETVSSKPPPEPEGVDQGAAVTIIETLVSSPSQAPAVGSEADLDEPLFPDGGGPLLSPRRSAAPARYYVAVGVNRRGRKGPPSAVAEVPLVPPPAPPHDVKIMYTDKSLSVSWMRPTVPLPRPIQEALAESGALGSRSVASFAGASGYNVYLLPRSPSTGSNPPPLLPAVTPLNPSLVATTQFEEPRVEFGVERCFIVRSQQTVGGATIESEASEMTCVTPVDTFAPAAPRSLAAVATEGAISLIWEPNTESDLEGYLVLRGEAAGEKLQALTTMPITDNTYRDTTVRSGVTYVYAVVAVDKANNVSAQSDRIEQRGQ